MRTNKLIEEIQKSDILQIEDILDAAMKRKRELYPDWEILYCAAEKGKINGVEDLLRTAWEYEMRIRKEFGE